MKKPDELDDLRGRTFWISVEAIHMLDVIAINEQRQKSDIVDEAIIEYCSKRSKKRKK